MIFKVVRSKYSLKVSKLIKVYKGAFRLENSLDVNLFDYNKSWDNLVGDDKVITTAELILVKFPLSICKKLTKNLTSVTQTKSVIRSGSLRICSFRKLTTDIVEPIMTMMKDGIKNLLKIK